MAASRVAVKYGLIAGVGTVAYFLLFYFIKKELLFNPFVYWASLGICLALMWSAIQEEKRFAGAPPGIRASLRTAFLVFVIANFIYYAFYFFLYGYADPGLVDLQREVMKESLEQSRNLLSEEQREQMLESLKGDKLNPTAGKVFFTFARSLIGGFVFSLGMAALSSREGGIG
ncbi:MAG: DUF4199 domain-containing protein [Phaeodactylibacter sp.]|nr:DUF4199 domain-containing protein [Phaeodactylibacter sp.]MCB9263695.1 DUF4199 domain-containing protein [Lewinellaceae bacterium]MCB9286898.1 DUF4199 domain-containing protein [Lewinellaceae bacterium]